MSAQQPDCKGDRVDCFDVPDWECYIKNVRDDCCATCEQVKANISLPFQGCQYGDRQGGCPSLVGATGVQCYDSATRNDCCETCFYLDSGYQDKGYNRSTTTTEENYPAHESQDGGNQDQDDNDPAPAETTGVGAAGERPWRYPAGTRDWGFPWSREGGNSETGSREGGYIRSRVEGYPDSPSDGEAGSRGRSFWRRRHHRPGWGKRRCGFGDREPGCQNLVGPNGRHCYDNATRYDCCETCFSFETAIPGCQYGDRAGNCKGPQCGDYSPDRLHECCDTCHEPGNVMTSSTWMPSDPSTTLYPYTSPAAVDSGGQGNPAWVVPVVASAAGIIVVLVVILVVCFLVRRRRGGKVPDAINEQMYNEYKMSKRAPMAPPRPDVDPDLAHKRSKLKRQDTGEYAYINPDDVQREPVKDNSTTLGKRTGNDPLPDRPNDPYTYLQNPDKYGYMEPIQKSSGTPGDGPSSGPAGPYTDLQGHTRQDGTGDPYTHLHQAANEEERRRQNSYGQFPHGFQHNLANSTMSERL